MRDAETVTFGGSDLDRAAHLRSDISALAALRQDPTGTHIVLWQGKPLVEGDEMDSLVRLSHDHPILAECDADALFLGMEEGGPVFGHWLKDYWPEGLDGSELGGFVDTTQQSHPTLRSDQVFAELRMIMTRLTARDAELAATLRAMVEWHRRHGFCACCGEKSEVGQGGWQRSCDACKSQHFPRTDPVVIMLITHGNSVLLGRSPGWPEGMYSLLAGFVEPGETLEAAVRREVMEEAGIKVGRVEYLASQPWAFPASLMTGFRGEALTKEIELDPAELEDAVWFTREQVAKAFVGQHPTLKPARKGAIAQFLLQKWLSDQLD